MSNSSPSTSGLLFLGFAICGMAMVNAHSADSLVLASQDLQKSNVEIEALRNQALHGDLKASNELEKYFGVFVGDDIQSEFWMRLSAELGDCGDTWELIRRSKGRSFFATKRETNSLQTEYWEEKWSANSCGVGAR